MKKNINNFIDNKLIESTTDKLSADRSSCQLKNSSIILLKDKNKTENFCNESLRKSNTDKIQNILDCSNNGLKINLNNND